MIRTAYTDPYREELAAYYAGFPHNVDALADAVTGWYEAHPDASSFRKRAESYSIMAEACEITIFPDFPLFFEIETGRERFDWGCNSRLGKLLFASSAERWAQPYAAEIKPYFDAGLFHGWNPVGLDHHCTAMKSSWKRAMPDSCARSTTRCPGEKTGAAANSCGRPERAVRRPSASGSALPKRQRPWRMQLPMKRSAPT